MVSKMTKSTGVVFFETVKDQFVLNVFIFLSWPSFFIQLSVFTCLVPDNSHLELAVKIDPFNPDNTFERWV